MPSSAAGQVTRFFSHSATSAVFLLCRPPKQTTVLASGRQPREQPQTGATDCPLHHIKLGEGPRGGASVSRSLPFIQSALYTAQRSSRLNYDFIPRRTLGLHLHPRPNAHPPSRHKCGFCGPAIPAADPPDRDLLDPLSRAVSALWRALVLDQLVCDRDCERATNSSSQGKEGKEREEP